MTDPESDVSVRLRGQAVGTATATHKSIDLTGLDVLEGASNITFVMHVVDLGGLEDLDGAVCEVFFAHNGRSFRMELLLSRASGTRASQYYRDDDGPWQWSLDDPGVQVDVSADTLALVVDRGNLADPSGTAPLAGRTLNEVHAACHRNPDAVNMTGDEVAFPLSMDDALPDEGQAGGSWSIQVGPPQTGVARLSSPRPFRASNGEATTYAYNVTGQNLANDPQEFVLSVHNVPLGVNVTLASERITIAGAGTLDFTVWASVPFAHEHGKTASFMLEMTSAVDPASVGRVELGVRYLTVPQPSGHHDTLFVHGAAGDDIVDLNPARAVAPGVIGGGSHGYMNTLDEDPGDAQRALAPTGGSWSIALAPSLLMGIDADLTRTGTWHASWDTTTPAGTFEIGGEVVIYLGRGLGAKTLAILDPTTATVGAGNRLVANGTLVPQSEADLVPFTNSGMALVWRLWAVPIDTAPNPIALRPGSWVQLPLVDYHDPLEGLPVAGAVVVAGLVQPGPSDEATAKPASTSSWVPLLALIVGTAAAWRRGRGLA